MQVLVEVPVEGCTRGDVAPVVECVEVVVGAGRGCASKNGI